MVILEAQETLTGEKLEFEKDRIETWKDIFRAKYFQLTVSEETHSKLDGWHGNGKSEKVRKWIASHMKPWQTLPEGSEGVCFQNDLALFTKVL